MKSEIRGLKVGEFYSEDDSLLLRLSRRDNGVVIEIADMDADIFYTVTVDENGITNFDWGNVTPTTLDDNKGADNGED